MANPLLVRAAPELLARQRQVIESVEKLSTFERLAAIVEKDLESQSAEQRPGDVRARQVRVDLGFDWADARERLPRVTGRLRARLPATCQRCLEACEIDLDVTVDLLLVASRDAQSIDDALEIWELEEDRLRPLDVAEELLIMAMPLAAAHADPRDCGTLAHYGGDAPRDTVRPFADLKGKLERSP